MQYDNKRKSIYFKFHSVKNDIIREELPDHLYTTTCLNVVYSILINSMGVARLGDWLSNNIKIKSR